VCRVAWAQDTAQPAVPAAPEGPSSESAPSVDADDDVALLKRQLEAERRLREEQQALFEQRLSTLEENQAAADEAQLLESLAADEEGAALGTPEKIQLYGFMDLNLQRQWIPKTSFYREVAGTREATFALGNVNLYFDARPEDHWRALVEVRFTNMPHGQEQGLGGLGGGYRRVNTNIWDFADLTGSNSVRWGGIILERAWLQYSYSDLLQVRAGQWFTPWGIWNIDHGWPTLIAGTLPEMILQQAIPRIQTGVQVLGRYNRPPYSFGYHVTVSNGRGDASLVDFTDNKAVGFRLFMSHSGRSEVQLGMTGYWGKHDDITKNLTSIEPVEIEVVNSLSSTEQAIGLDFSLDYGSTRLRAEGLISSRRYEEGRRGTAQLEPPGVLEPDRIRYNTYVILAHRIGWFEPFILEDLEYIPTGRGDALLASAPGVNTHFSPYSHIKWQYGYAHFFDLKANDGDHSVHNFHVLSARWVLAF
jgi:hypothetical protein